MQITCLRCLTRVSHEIGRRFICTPACQRTVRLRPTSVSAAESGRAPPGRGLRTAGSWPGAAAAAEAGGAPPARGSWAAAAGGGCQSRQSHASCRCLSSRSGETVMNVFDRKAKRAQRNRTAGDANCETYDYLKEEVGYRVADRVCDVSRKFSVAVDIGCGRGHVGKHIYKDMVDLLFQCDMAEDVLAQSEVSSEVPTVKVHCDEEFFPFKENSVDLAVSSLSLHWVNDLPGVFSQIHKALKPDGCVIGAMFGGETLFELRVSLQLAEQELEGGIAPHISPFTSVQDLGNLLNRAGFCMLTIDVDEMVVNFPSMFELMRDLKGMGENNCAWKRKLHLRRSTTKKASEIYKEMYSVKGDQEGVRATFNIINFIAWKPGPTQEKIATRGSGQVSLKDIDKLDHLTRELDSLRSETKGRDGLDSSLKHLTEQMEKLKNTTITNNKDENDESIPKK